MSKEDREFLEKVMAEGIIDENERMKFILQEATKALEYYKAKFQGDSDVGDPPISDDDLEDLLQELRDIVEQTHQLWPHPLLKPSTSHQGSCQSHSSCRGILSGRLVDEHLHNDAQILSRHVG